MGHNTTIGSGQREPLQTHYTIHSEQRQTLLTCLNPGSLVGIIFGGLAIFTSGIAWKDSTFVKTSTGSTRARSRADYNHQAHVNDAKAKNNQKKKTTMYDFIIADGSH